MADEVLYERRDRVALITLNRPQYANAQNSAMTYALGMSVFGLHHLAHAHNAETSGHSLAGLDARGMRDQK